MAASCSEAGSCGSRACIGRLSKSAREGPGHAALVNVSFNFMCAVAGNGSGEVSTNTVFESGHCTLVLARADLARVSGFDDTPETTEDPSLPVHHIGSLAAHQAALPFLHLNYKVFVICSSRRRSLGGRRGTGPRRVRCTAKTQSVNPDPGSGFVEPVPRDYTQHLQV